MTDSSTPGSVLYVTESPVTDEPAFATAQKYAIAHQLPFAVVYCLQEQDPDKQLKIIGSFRGLEAFLRQYSIPLMILIGQRDKVLPWMSGHVKPVRIFTADDKSNEGATLQNHPTDWPGRVMTVPELQALVSGDQKYCLPD